MARPREFDETAALDAAIECFRRRGYEATSVRDLTACMGIGPTSLYNSFGDKRALFALYLGNADRSVYLECFDDLDAAVERAAQELGRAAPAARSAP